MNSSPPKFEAAEEPALNYLRLAEYNRDEVEIQRALVTIGNVYLERALQSGTNFFEKSEYAKKCQNHLKDSIDYIAKLPSNQAVEKAKMELVSLRNLIYLACDVDNSTEAVALVNQAKTVTLESRLSSRSDLCFSLSRLTKYFIEKGDFIAANSYYIQFKDLLRGQESEESYVELNADLTRCRVRLLLADKSYDEIRKICAKVSRQENKRSIIKKEMKKFLQLVKKIKDVEEKLLVRTKDSLLWEELGDFYDKSLVKFRQKAIQAYEQSLKYADTDSNRKSDLCYSLGSLHEEQRDWFKAKKYYSQEISESTDSAESSAMGALRCSCYLKESVDIFNCISILKQSTKDSELRSFLSKAKEDFKTLGIGREILDRILNHDKIRYQEPTDYEDVSDSDSSDDSDSVQAEENSNGRRTARLKLNAKGETKLQMAINNTKSTLDDIKTIIQQNSSIVNHVDKAGFTALRDACIAGNLEIVQVLIESGADVKLINEKNGTTPLMDVCTGGYTYLIQTLLDAGVNPNIRDTSGWSAADYLDNLIKKTCKETPRSKMDAKDQHELDLACRLLQKLRGLEKSTSMMRQKKGIMSRNLTEEVKENDEVMIEDDFVPIKKSFEKKTSKYKLSTSQKKAQVFEEPLEVLKAKSSNSMPEKPKAKRPISNEIPELKRPTNQEDKKRQSEEIVTLPEVKKPRLSVEDNPEKMETFYVNIEGSLLKVFLKPDAIVEDLALEAARLYFDIYDKKPNLKLFDEMGAELYGKYKMALILSTSKSITFASKVINWIGTPIDQAYKSFCSKLNITHYPSVESKLAKSKTDGSVYLKHLNHSAILPVFKALDNQDQIEELTFHMCELSINFSQFCSSLSHLKNISTLHLPLNQLSYQQLSCLSKISSLTSLKTLDLSYNNLEDRSLPLISKVILQNPSLSCLKISSCGFSKDFSLEKKLLHQLEELDVAFNRLGVIGICHLCTVLQDSNALKTLNLRNCIRIPDEEDKVRRHLLMLHAQVNFKGNGIKFP